jgi:hypothetical protein
MGDKSRFDVEAVVEDPDVEGGEAAWARSGVELPSSASIWARNDATSAWRSRIRFSERSLSFSTASLCSSSQAARCCRSAS